MNHRASKHGFVKWFEGDGRGAVVVGRVRKVGAHCLQGFREAGGHTTGEKSRGRGCSRGALSDGDAPLYRMAPFCISTTELIVLLYRSKRSVQTDSGVRGRELFIFVCCVST